MAALPVVAVADGLADAGWLAVWDDSVLPGLEALALGAVAAAWAREFDEALALKKCQPRPAATKRVMTAKTAKALPVLGRFWSGMVLLEIDQGVAVLPLRLTES
jgi:hypothetical protein